MGVVPEHLCLSSLQTGPWKETLEISGMLSRAEFGSQAQKHKCWRQLTKAEKPSSEQVAGGVLSHFRWATEGSGS